jgi:mannan endo-1,4-beta-mannosidase
MYRSLLFILGFWATGCGFSQTIEAETGLLSGTQPGSQLSGYTGSGYVTGFDAEGDKLTVTINASKGIYDLYVRYASPSGDKFNFVYVNGENLGSVAFPSSTSFRETKVGKVYLTQGSNTLSVIKDWGYFDVDNFRLEASTPSDIYNLTPDPVTASISARADIKVISDKSVKVYRLVKM